jgi:hypothetical protein
MTLRNLVLDNFGWKLISLMLAVLVWWRINNLVELEPTPPVPAPAGPGMPGTLTLTLPVRVLAPARTPRGFTVTPGDISVTLWGRPDVLRPLTTNDILAYVEAYLAPSARSARLPVVVRPPAGVTVQAVQPPEILVERM